MNVLILTNMPEDPSKPYLGQFVRDQYKELKGSRFCTVDYYCMKVMTSRITSKFKYIIFFMSFIKHIILKRKRYDIIHIHFFYPTIILALTYKLFRNTKCKLVVTFHGSDIYHYSPPSKVYRLATRFIDYPIFVSRELMKRFFQPVTNYAILSAGISNDFYQKRTFDRDIDILFVGTLDKNKGTDRLISLLKQLKKPMKVTVVGCGEYHSALSSLRSVHDVKLLGSMKSSELAIIYSRSKILLNLSRNESFGLVLTEAMASGCIVIATSTDGAKAQITNNSGFIIDSENSENALINSVEKTVLKALALNDTQRLNINNNALKLSKIHSIKNVSSEIEKIYITLTHGGR
ncbi:glycosyltransferase family 4 protein [Flocculibacter collagenilyticus]|uniref:glycosyltransferase family 4 protein n=1 Tax=Flocculibacter collagenilyticus TaxID=2744479 RepID=UPI0018F75994|nr:glycosyltransferase family 4 protein [Flocculibacter collagenilyticus]